MALTRTPAIVTATSRAAPTFGETLMRTEPMPRPVAGDTSAHETSLPADQLHTAWVLIPMMIWPPSAGTVSVPPVKSNRHGAGSSATFS
jgi:hypothetical protein